MDVYKRFSSDFGWPPDFDQNKVLELSNNSYIILVFSEVSLNSILPHYIGIHRGGKKQIFQDFL